jgi:catechol 2,3-dioxygenase-like lactoylglutathione lyase family enzyme
MPVRPARLLVSLVAFGLVPLGYRPQEANRQTPEPVPSAIQTQQTHFHHLHLNTVDPKAAIGFYTGKFDCEKARFAGVEDGVWTQKSWLLFNKVSKPPAWELTSAIWHFGWGAEDMKATYQKHLEMGTKFFTPLTDISDIGGNTGATGRFYYAYVQSPDNALVELNTASHHRFGHLHLFSADPVAAGAFYTKYLGAKPRSNRPPSREPRFYRGVQIGPSASLLSDNVNIIIYPVEYAKKVYAAHWDGKTGFDSTQGRVIDHVSFSFDRLSEALEEMRSGGVRVTSEIRTAARGKFKHAFIEGPDRIRIELIEGHASK